jgi:hypothetical protein
VRCRWRAAWPVAGNGVVPRRKGVRRIVLPARLSNSMAMKWHCVVWRWIKEILILPYSTWN